LIFDFADYTMRFAKAHAYGNDFLYVERSLVADAAIDALARQICDRHQGVGADGLIVYERTGDVLSMQLFNADGSVAEVSGNGVRALGALALRDDPRADALLTIDTAAGSKVLRRIGRQGELQTFHASMGSPAGLREMTLDVAGEPLRLVALSMGNPQAVVLGKLPDLDRFRRVGAALERHAAFPAGTNVEFAEVEAPDRIRILIWERGVGPTSSSGTGSCAALVAAAAHGGAARAADVVAPGGTQRVEWRHDSVYLTGWAEVLCEGEWLRQIPRTR
jgi:diaminopimelate epimerase